MTKMHLGKWGRSLAVRLPQSLVKRFDLKEGDIIDTDMLEQAIIQTRLQVRAEALERMSKTRWEFPEGYRFDREEANAR